jgi:hypothetical protein
MRVRTFRHLLMLACLATWLPAVSLAQQGSGCIAHRPQYIDNAFEVTYDAGCSGHDEPELDPVSSLAGSARELTWTVVLPTDGSFGVTATGPTFWFGGTVTDRKSLFEQAFVELQFYPDSIVTNCTGNGGFIVKYSPNTYSACSPVWKLTTTGKKGVFHETAAFNAMLTDGTGQNNPLIMHAADTVTVHWYTTQAQDGFHVTVTDLNTGSSGTIVLNSQQDGRRRSATRSLGEPYTTRPMRSSGKSDTPRHTPSRERNSVYPGRRTAFPMTLRRGPGHRPSRSGA